MSDIHALSANQTCTCKARHITAPIREAAMSEHTPTPYRLEWHTFRKGKQPQAALIAENGDAVAVVIPLHAYDAEFILHACNFNDDLLIALEGVLALATGFTEALAKTGLDVTIETELLVAAGDVLERAAIDKAKNTQVTGRGIHPASSE